MAVKSIVRFLSVGLGAAGGAGIVQQFHGPLILSAACAGIAALLCGFAFEMM